MDLIQLIPQCSLTFFIVSCISIALGYPQEITKTMEPRIKLDTSGSRGYRIFVKLEICDHFFSPFQELSEHSWRQNNPFKNSNSRKNTINNEQSMIPSKHKVSVRYGQLLALRNFPSMLPQFLPLRLCTEVSCLAEVLSM